jgi:hypothetical protein
MTCIYKRSSLTVNISSEIIVFADETSVIIYRVAQKSFNVASLLLNIQCQGTFAPPCILMATCRYRGGGATDSGRQQ